MGKKRDNRRVLCFSILALFIVAAILIGGTISGFASTSKSQNITNYKYYTSIIIEPGDSLWEIASEYMTSEYSDVEEYIMEVMTLNHLMDDEIMAGEYLTIPYYSAEIL